MKVSDIDSIIHILKSISPWGMLFLILIILPIYIALWIGIIKLLGLSIGSKKKLLVVIFLTFAIALILLKFGVNEDENLKLSAERIKQYLITYGYHSNSFANISRSIDINLKPKDFEKIIRRFPEDFTITYYNRDTTSEKGILLTNEEAIKRIQMINHNVVPYAHTVLDNYMKIDTLISFPHISDFIDHRFNWQVLEFLTQKYPAKFTQVFAGETNVYYLKKIK